MFATNSRFSTFRVILAAVGLSTSLCSIGCETEGQTGALVGGGTGALAGQAIGGNTEATLIGAAVGTGLGYIIGNEVDKDRARSTPPPPRSEPYRYPSPSSHSSSSSLPHDALAGTRWEVISLAPSDATPEYVSRVIEFRRGGRLVTTTTQPSGSVVVEDERYRAVGSALIIDRPGRLVNARYRIDGDEMIIDAEQFRVVLRRLRP